jgi:hypothetical protein
MLRTLLPLALIATAGVSYAQTTPAPAPTSTAPAPTMTAPAQPLQTQTQTAPAQSQAMPAQATPAPAEPMPGATAGAVDANGQPIIGRNDWVRQPGDRPDPRAQSPKASPDVAAAPTPARPRASGVGQPGPDGTFRDEYGFRYDAQGNRIDARGRIMQPPMSRQ